MTSCIVEETVESSTFLATSKSIELLARFFAAQPVVDVLYCFVMDRGESKLSRATVHKTALGLYIRLSGKASHLMMTNAEFKLLLRSNTLTSVTYLFPHEFKTPWVNSGTLTRLQSTLSKLADEA